MCAQTAPDGFLEAARRFTALEKEMWMGAQFPNEPGSTSAQRPVNQRLIRVNRLPSDSAERKSIPMVTGVVDYFPDALAEVAKVSKAGNDKHNPGQPMHHARGKSTDHADSIMRHLVERGGIDPDTGVRHTAELAWRALALLQQELEDEGAPLARGAKLPPAGSTTFAQAARAAAGMSQGRRL